MGIIRTLSSTSCLEDSSTATATATATDSVQEAIISNRMKPLDTAISETTSISSSDDDDSNDSTVNDTTSMYGQQYESKDQIVICTYPTLPFDDSDTYTTTGRNDDYRYSYNSNNNDDDDDDEIPNITRNESIVQTPQQQHNFVSQSPTSVIPRKSHDQRDSTGSTIANTTTTTTTTTTNTDKTTVPSSLYVLNVAFYSFIGFMLVQGVVAKYIAHSSAMMADCEAMSVDALTYLFNLYAEQQKNRPYTKYELQHFTTVEQRRRHRELINYYYEFIPPTLSVVTLILVTIYTIQTSMVTIHTTNSSYNSALSTATTIDDDMTAEHTTSNINNKDTVSIPIMLLFSFINLLLDVVNVSCFTRSGFVTMAISQPQQQQQPSNKKAQPLLQQQQPSCCHGHTTPIQQQQRNDDDDETSRLLIRSGDYNDNSTDSSSTTSTTTTEMTTTCKESMDHSHPKLSYNSIIDQFHDDMIIVNENDPDAAATSHEVNLNMCSAWTHICADTMRSTAVLLAAGIALCIPTTSTMQQQYYATMADSIAALAVSIIILVSIIPLLRALYHTGQQILRLRRERHRRDKHQKYDSSSATSTTTRRNNKMLSYQSIDV